MSLEHPSLHLNCSANDLAQALTQVSSQIQAQLEPEPQGFGLKGEFSISLSEKEQEEHITNLASRRNKSNEYWYFFAFLFFIILFAEMLLIDGMFSKNTQSFVEQAQNQPAVELAVLYDGVSPLVLSLFPVALVFLGLTLRARKGRKARLQVLKAELRQQGQEELVFKTRPCHLGLHLFDHSPQQCELVFDLRQGQELVPILVGKLIELKPGLLGLGNLALAEVFAQEGPRHLKQDTQNQSLSQALEFLDHESAPGEMVQALQSLLALGEARLAN